MSITETKGEQTVEELIAERKYLLRWFGGFNAELRGLSADALTRFSYYGGEPDDYPRDEGDLRRCERAYAAMPPHLQVRALPLLEKWRDDLEKAADSPRDFSGQDLRTWREAAGFSRRELAERARCSESTLVNLERGDLPRRSFVLPSIMAVLDEAVSREDAR